MNWTLGSDLTGERLGSWRVEERIDSTGGRSEVYRAERMEGGFRQTVAVKVLRPGVPAEELENEREHLDRLKGSAFFPTVFYQGVTPDGRPYLVMEYIRGQDLRSFADSLGMTIQERLELFNRLCVAAEYMHSRSVFHLDLKPSNVMVTPEGAVKVIDFGTARGQRLDGTAGRARLDDPITREYTSPEQINPDSLLTMAADVYALGSLLYRLLTGRTPLQLSERPPEEHMEAIRTEIPLKASEAAQREAARDPRIAIWRQTESKSLSGILRGDLDSILTGALRKDPAHRYETVNKLHTDIMRFLNGERPLMKADGLGYRAVQATRSRPAWAAAIGLVLVSFYARLIIYKGGEIMYEDAGRSWSILHEPMQQAIDGWRRNLRPLAASEPRYRDELRELDRLIGDVEALAPPSSTGGGAK